MTPPITSAEGTTTTATDVIRRTTNALALRNSSAALVYLRLMHEDWEWGTKHFGDPYTRALCRLVLIGWMEHKPFDLSDIALALDVSRQQVMRRVDQLMKDELVIEERKRNRVIVHPTDKLIARIHECIYERISSRGKRWARLMGINSSSSVSSAPTTSGSRSSRA